MTRAEHSEWLGRIDRARGLQGKQHDTWNKAVDLYKCVYFDKIYSGGDGDRVDVHFANWYLDLLVALTYFRDPFIFVKPKHASYSAFADTMEIVENYHWRELKLKGVFKKAIRSGFMMPPGWIKIGYMAKIGEDVAKEQNLLAGVKNLLLGPGKLPEEQGVFDESIKEESIFASWVPSWNMLMPDGYQEISKMPYLIEIEDVPIIDFKANPFYKNKNIKASKSTKDTRGSGEGQEVGKVTFKNVRVPGGEDETETITLYHIWDKRSQKRFTLSFENNDPHFEGKWPYDMEGFPYRPLIFDDCMPGKNEPYPYPVNALTPIMPQIIEQSQSRTMMVKYRKRASAAILVQKGLMTEDEYKQLCENEMLQVIPVLRGNC